MTLTAELMNASEKDLDDLQECIDACEIELRAYRELMVLLKRRLARRGKIPETTREQLIESASELTDVDLVPKAEVPAACTSCASPITAVLPEKEDTEPLVPNIPQYEPQKARRGRRPKLETQQARKPAWWEADQSRNLLTLPNAVPIEQSPDAWSQRLIDYIRLNGPADRRRLAQACDVPPNRIDDVLLGDFFERCEHGWHLKKQYR